MEVPVQRLNEKMTEIIADRERSYHGRFSTAEKRVFKAVGSVEKAAANLREAVGQAWGAMSRPAELHGTRLSEQVLEACGSLTAHRPDASYEELRKFQGESIQIVRAILQVYNRYAPSIIRGVKSETSALQDSIAELSRIVTEIEEALDDSDLRNLQLIARNAERVAQTAGELSLKNDEIHKAKENIKVLQDQQARVQDDLSVLGRDQALREFNQLEQQIGQREAEILALLEPLLKPLRKIEKGDSKAIEAPIRATVSKVIENPLAAVLEIPVGQMRELLVSVYQLLDHDKLLPDQRRKRKAAEAIRELQAGALDRFREDHGILEANRREILRQLKGSGVYNQWLPTRKRSDDLRAEITQCLNQLAELQSEEMRLHASVLADKGRVESALKKVLKDDVTILI